MYKIMIFTCNNNTGNMTLNLSYVSSWKGDDTVTWFVQGVFYGPFKGGAVPPPLTLDTSANVPITVTAFASVNCNPAASITIFPTVDPAPKVFGGGLFLSAQAVSSTSNAVVVTLSGSSNCPSTASTWPHWATILIVVLVIVIILAVVILASMSVIFNYYKIKHIRRQFDNNVKLNFDQNLAEPIKFLQ